MLYHIRERFMYGDVTPAVILDPRAGVVATYTNMNIKMRRRFLGINVFAEKLDRLPSLIKVSDTFAAASIYGTG